MPSPPSDVELGSVPEQQAERSNGNINGDSIPRPKRIACILCRKRKLRCDGNRPSCGTCSRLGHDCAYDEVRKKSGPKRGYVKQLEARLAQVETLLKTQDPTEKDDGPVQNFADAPSATPPFTTPPQPPDPASNPLLHDSTDTTMFDPQLGFLEDPLLGMNNDFSWEMISLGVEEPLPEPEVMNEMNEIFFSKVYPLTPMIHRARFYGALNLSPHMRPAICLRYAMWTHVASVTPKYRSAQEHFYTRARKYAEADEMKSQGELMVTLGHVQCWNLIAIYEFKHMLFPRAWASVGRAARLALMMGFNRLDVMGLDVKQCIPPPRDWTEREERRRAFWVAFCHDRYASVGTGWPMAIDERDIMTQLPSSEDAFQKGFEEKSPMLDEIIGGKGIDSISSFSGVSLMAYMFGRNFHHLHRPDSPSDETGMNSPFWKRHRLLDNILLTTSLSLPPSLRLPQGLSDPNVIYTNMTLHTATISLHQAAIFRADKDRSVPSVAADSKRRCIVAAEQITNVMKMISTIDLSLLNPFTSFTIYIAARVFVQYLKSVPEDSQARSSLQFLITALRVLQDASPLTASFTFQLDMELENSNLNDLRKDIQVDQMNPAMAQMSMNDSVKCSPLFEIRESQAQGVVNQPNTLDLKNASEYGGLPAGIRPNITQNKSAGSDIYTFTSGSSPDVPMSRQETSFSTNLDIPSDSSRSNSNHPTPSTTSHRGSTNTSSSSPAFGNTGTSQASFRGGDMLFRGTETTFNYGTTGFNNFKEQSIPLGFSANETWPGGSRTGLTPKHTTGDSWIAELENPELIQQSDGTDWVGWDANCGRQ